MAARYNIRMDGPLGDPNKPFKLLALDALDLSQGVVSSEPNLRLCDEATVMRYGGGLTRTIRDVVAGLIFGSLHTGRIYRPGTVLYDVRTHHMKPGDIPSYNTVWHVDAERTYGFQTQHVQTIHFLFLSGPPLTEFIAARDLKQAPLNPPTFCAPSAKLVTYNSTELHRARPYEGAEPMWRYFFRATWFPVMPARKDVFSNEVYAGPTTYKQQR